MIENRSSGDNKSYQMLELSNGMKRINLVIPIDHSKYHFLGLANAFMIFTKIADPTNQKDQEILVYDIESGKVVKQIKGRNFSGFKSSHEFEVIHLGFENVRKEKVSLEEFRQTSELMNEDFQIEFPYLLHKSDDQYHPMKELIDASIQGELVSEFELLECNEKLLAGVHIKVGTCLEKSILILDEEGVLVKKIDFYSKLDKRTTDTFFVYGNFLIFVSEYQRLHLLDKNAI
jgi:hypothetical protein